MSVPNQLEIRKARVLLIEDSLSLAEIYKEYLRSEPYQVLHVETGGEALALIERDPPHVLLLDLNLPDMNGMSILDHVCAEGLSTSVVIITAHGSVDVAVEAMRRGAFDFLVKPFNAGRLNVTLRNALERQRLTRIVDALQEGAREGYYGFIGASLAMQAVYRIIDAAAPSKATVFITGESGTGKEICAQAIHSHSPRRDGPFVPLNCAAIPRDLMESEIFGHIKGAFTGATTDRKGAAALADGGTLFLDEICEMDLELQSKLLRFIQTGCYQPVGASRSERVDVRFICATNRDPLAEVDEGRFREDLFYRLHVIPLPLPPLRERDQDVLAIARYFLGEYAREEGKDFKTFAPEVEAMLLDFDWPGNIRQLQNVVRNIVVLNQGQTVTPTMLPLPFNRLQLGQERPVSRSAEPREMGGSALRSLAEIERQAIEEAIARCEGNIPKAAALLDISASTIYRKRQAWAEQT